MIDKVVTGLCLRAGWGLLCCLIGAHACAAEEWRDARTGFGVDLPANIRADVITEPRAYEANVGLNPVSGKPERAGQDKYLCEAGFNAREAYRIHTRETIADMMGDPEILSLLKAPYEKFGIKFLDPVQFEHHAYRAVELEGRAAPAQADIRIYIAYYVTPKGYATLRCVVNAGDYPSALPLFRSLRSALKIPG